MIPTFGVARLPRICFGSGVIAQLPQWLIGFGERALILTGARAFRETAHWHALTTRLCEIGVAWQAVKISGEPSPERIDEVVREFHPARIDVVVAIGGGSVLDAGKAVAGLLRPGNTVMDHLEGVGRGAPYAGPATPFIAAPTTAGTGSEATKNAVLSRHGPDGFKKSFRDDALVAEVALVDPELLASCSPAQMAANGLDALTQLMESFVSLKANPFTDALAVSGIRAVREHLFAAYAGGQEERAQAGRAGMAYASLVSGITLAQVGLGSVHGLASPLGAFFPIPHGVVCGTLLAEATRGNIAAMDQREPRNPALEKYAQLGALIAGETGPDPGTQRDALCATLEQWTTRLALPALGSYGVTDRDIERIVADSRGSSMQTNPIVLEDSEIAALVRARL